MMTKRSTRKQTSNSQNRRAKRTKAGKPPAPRAGDVGAGSNKSARAGQPVKERRPSALSAAAQVLAAAGGPLSAGEMVKRMLAKGLWKTSGKTPAATLYSALLRRIRKDCVKSRFRKVGRGKFDLAK